MQKIVKFFLDIFYAIAGLFGKKIIKEDPHREKEKAIEEKLKNTKTNPVEEKSLEDEVGYWNKQ